MIRLLSTLIVFFFLIASGEGARVHIVKEGETLFRISKVYDISLENLKRANSLSSFEIKKGQKLLILNSQSDKKTGCHIVKPGETLFRISKDYGVSQDSLMKANSLLSPRVKVGQRLIIPDLPAEEKGAGSDVPKRNKLVLSISLDRFRIKTIVIDPGHGGKDAGAIGKGGLLEKDVTLDIARRLASELKRSLQDVNILMTREDDYFIPLRQRTAFANQNKADLFISIHANSAYSRQASGFEVYHLSLVASDSRARAIAAAENEVLDMEADNQNRKRIDPVSLILGDLAQNEFINESAALAGWIQAGIDRELGLDKRGIKGAFFWVLKDAMMPAVLIETAFISNPIEEEKLKSEGFKNRIATAIAASIIKYKTTYEEELLQIAKRG